MSSQYLTFSPSDVKPVSNLFLIKCQAKFQCSHVQMSSQYLTFSPSDVKPVFNLFLIKCQAKFQCSHVQMSSQPNFNVLSIRCQARIQHSVLQICSQKTAETSADGKPAINRFWISHVKSGFNLTSIKCQSQDSTFLPSDVKPGFNLLTIRCQTRIQPSAIRCQARI